MLTVSPSGIKSLVENEGTRMPAKRELTMRQIRQMLRLARDGVSAREIGRTLGVEATVAIASWVNRAILPKAPSNYARPLEGLPPVRAALLG